MSTKADIVIPEQADDRIESTKKKLSSMGFSIVETEDFARNKIEYIDFLSTKEFAKNWSVKMLTEYLDNPIHFGSTIVANGDADCIILGAVTPKDEIIRTAIRTIGIKQNSKFVFSSTFLLHRYDDISYTYADCSVLPEPNPDQLAVIAGETAKIYRYIFGEIPEVAFISFSTLASMEHYRIDRVRKAMEIFARKFKDINFVGELQLDSAVDPLSAKYKSVENEIQGNANVLIFPNMDAGNVAVKSAELFGEFTSAGPLLQGLNNSVGMVSRACSVENIINTVALTTMEVNKYADIQL